MRRLAGATELLDGPLDATVLAGNLRDLRRVNRWLGGANLSWRALERVWSGAPLHGPPLRLLDVGTGSADIPRYLVRRARASRRALEVVATDVRPELVEHARRHAGGEAGLTIVLDTPDRIDHETDSFDVVHASLVLHHLDPPAAAALLGEMARVARRAVIINDLVRARRWWIAAWLLTRIGTANRYTRHDAPLSVQRAYLPVEVAQLAGAAGLSLEGILRDRLGHRYALVLAHRPLAATLVPEP